MIVFFSDIDNTLIYSRKYDIGMCRIGVEEYQGRTISYMTPGSYRLLAQLRQQILFMPVTTRTAEQYARISFGFCPEYALVCNGGILLEKGEENRAWYEDSLKMIKGAGEELRLGAEYLAGDRYRNFEVRNIRGLFIFTKSSRPGETAGMLKNRLDKEQVDVFRNGEKVYIVPKKLNKGMACRRFLKRMHRDNVYTIAAGDSGFDVPMLKEADLFMAPKALCDTYGLQNGEIWRESAGVFSDFILGHIADAGCAPDFHA